MKVLTSDVKRLTFGGLTVVVHPSREAAGKAAALDAACYIRGLSTNRATVGVIFATGASQIAMLQALTGVPDLPWGQIIGFHMDEYLDLPSEHHASFRHYLRKQLTSIVPLHNFFEISGDRPSSEVTCSDYASLLRSHDCQLCLLGVGENGHLAFNDPPVAKFWDPADVKVVSLDTTCRQQQVAEGWFSHVDQVPTQAITLTIPTLLRVPKLIISAPGLRKAAIIRRTLDEAISTDCPSTILRAHHDATIYLDQESASELDVD